MNIMQTQRLSFFNESNPTNIELQDKLIEYIRILVKKIYDLCPNTFIEYIEGDSNIIVPINKFLLTMKQTIEQVENKKQMMQRNKNKLYEILNQQNENEKKLISLQQPYNQQIDQYQMFDSLSLYIAKNNADEWKGNKKIFYGSYEIEKLSHKQVQEQIVILLKDLQYYELTEIFDNSKM